MNLPDLPKQYNRKEAKIDDKVGQWFLENYPEDVAIEVKVKGNKALPHQLIALWQVAKGIFKYKIPDMMRRNPFDIVILKKAHAYIVTCDGNKCHAVQIGGESQEFDFKV